MAWRPLPWKYDVSATGDGLTSLAGLPLYIELAHRLGLPQRIREHVRARPDGRGWSDVQMVLAGLLLNVAGGDCVDDLDRLQHDEGFCRVLERSEEETLSRAERRSAARLRAKEGARRIPSASSMFRYLGRFHDPAQEKLRARPGEPKAFIPKPLPCLRGLGVVNAAIAEFAARQEPLAEATLDLDATIVPTEKSPTFTYKGFRGYQPLNVWWAEAGLFLFTEFRDGNVPAGYEQTRVLDEALRHLPPSVRQVRLRGDTAAHEHELLRYCDGGQNAKVGRIEFAVSCDVTEAFKKAVAEVEPSEWKPLYRTECGVKMATQQEWAEVCFVSDKEGRRKKQGEAFRYLALREEFREQLKLPGLEDQEQGRLPFQTVVLGEKRYKLFGIVTNIPCPDRAPGRGWDGNRLITWQRERCGKSEEAHAVVKDDLAGGTMPSHDFGENAAWWWMAVIAHNLTAVLKRHIMGPSWAAKRMKAIRYWLINVPGRVVTHARELIVRLAQGTAGELIARARRSLLALAPG